MSSERGELPVCNGTINTLPAKFLRDTGTTRIICRRKFVDDNAEIEGKQECRVADGRTVMADIVEIYLESKYLKFY